MSIIVEELKAGRDFDASRATEAEVASLGARMFARLREEAATALAAPLTAPLQELVATSTDLATLVARRLSECLAQGADPALAAAVTAAVNDYLRTSAGLRALVGDLLFALRVDPAVLLLAQPALLFKGTFAVCAHRVAHGLWKSGGLASALWLQARAAELWGADIHPAATLGCGVMLDHGEHRTCTAVWRGSRPMSTEFTRLRGCAQAQAW